ncbi:MAG: 2-amino-4-hydroxy-6-hydroxymethyldihydropteridine diphosphokinase [Chloroflexi bacterium]|nr:MAG: 2-amino-4-hydroxy-6-hydroxymethyldihydropteridine diphosphokinase [Chloroflexota bacterium]
MNQVFVLLGSNIDKEKNLPTAVSLLRQSCTVTAVSSVYETIPVGLRHQPNFWNTAVLLATPLDAPTLHQTILRPLEQQLNRVRTYDKNAPRTIDADIILFNNDVFDFDHHHIPDPDLLRFPHVAVPIAELAPQMPHPETREPLAKIAQRLLAELTAREGQPVVWKRPDVQLS